MGVRWDAPEKLEAGVKQSVQAAWEFREREEVLLEREAGRVLVRQREEARQIAERMLEKSWLQGDSQVHGRGFPVFADL